MPRLSFLYTCLPTVVVVSVVVVSQGRLQSVIFLTDLILLLLQPHLAVDLMDRPAPTNIGRPLKSLCE
jgi:hypothetical protein